MREDFFPDTNKIIIKYQESSNFWIFKTGKRVYKVKKKAATQSSIALDELFCKEAVATINIHSPSLETELMCVVRDGDQYTLQKKDKKIGLYTVIAMNQLLDRHFLDTIIEKGKVSEKMIGQIVDFLYRFHEQTSKSNSKEDGTPEHLNALLQDLFYQSKKYLGVTISQAIIDMILHPLEKYLVNHRKLFLRRIKKGFIKKTHGCFIPGKINIQKDTVVALSRSTDPLKNKHTDVAADLADLIVELNQAELGDLSAYLIKRYSRISGDKEIKQILPFYRAIKCLTIGNKHSVAMQNSTGNVAAVHQSRATRYYEQIIDIMHKL